MTMTNPHDSLLGQRSDYPEHYDPTLLFPIARTGKRAELGIDGDLPFHGVDIWNAWELSWLDARGKPQVAIGEFRVPASSPHLVESKSLKLYLNSWNQTRVESAEALRSRIAADLSHAAGAGVGVRLIEVDRFDSLPVAELDGECIDDLDIDCDHHGSPDPELLRADASGPDVSETLRSNLLKSNCPVTGQPDWASVQIAYTGAAIEREGLLRYLVSFRRHDDFHEQCIERIFTDIQRRCAPRSLTVYARYTRRGGLDINPWRSSEVHAPEPHNRRSARQ